MAPADRGLRRLLAVWLLVLACGLLAGCAQPNATVPSRTVQAARGAGPLGCGNLTEIHPRSGVTCWAWKCGYAGGLQCLNDEPPAGHWPALERELRGQPAEAP